MLSSSIFIMKMPETAERLGGQMEEYPLSPVFGHMKDGLVYVTKGILKRPKGTFLGAVSACGLAVASGIIYNNDRKRSLSVGNDESIDRTWCSGRH